MMYIKFYPFQMSKFVFKLFHFHFGFCDRMFLWVVNGRVLEVLFIKIR